MGHIRSWTNAPVKLISIMGNIVFGYLARRSAMSHRPCDSTEDTGAVSSLSGGKRLGHKPRSAHEEISPTGAAYRRSSRQPSASISAPLAALFLVLLCWALCMRTLCAPIGNKQLDLTLVKTTTSQQALVTMRAQRTRKSTSQVR